MKVAMVYSVDLEAYLDRFDGDIERAAAWLEEFMDVEVPSPEWGEYTNRQKREWLAAYLVQAFQGGDYTHEVQYVETEME